MRIIGLVWTGLNYVTQECVILSTVGVIFVGRLVCFSERAVYGISYTGSLDRSTRASEHVTVRLVYPLGYQDGRFL